MRTTTPRDLTLLAAFASAFAAASHEAAWPRLLTRWTGHAAWSTGLCLGVFMAGLGAGSLLPLARPSSLRRAARAWGLAELVVALGAAGALALLASCPPPSALTGAPRALDLVLAALALLPAALAMGATFPLLVAASTRTPTALYAAGLAGACVGALTTASVVAPAAGTWSATALAALVNLALAASSRALPETPPRGDSDEAPALRALVTGEAALFAAAGFFGLGAQAVLTRVLVPYAGVSSFAFAALVAVYVAAQALGVALARRGGAPSRTAPLVAAAPAVALASAALSGLVGAWQLPRDAHPLPWSLATLAAVGLVVAPTAALLGAAQAVALDAVDQHAHRGHAAAVVTGVGTLASAPAPLVATLALVPALGPRASLVALALPLVAVVARVAPRAALVGAVAAVALAVAAPGPRHFLGPEFDRAPVLYASASAQDTTAVVLHDQPLEPAIRRLVSAGVSYSGDSLFAQRYMRLLAHLPALAARGRARALVVCVGTGTTLDALRMHGFARVDAVDLDPTLPATLAHFRHVHHDVLDDPRVRLHIDDGDRFLAASPAGSFDVVTLEPPPPRAPGGTSLYTVELYRRAARALREGGVVAQWLPLHDLGAWEAGALTAAFVEVFPRATLHLAERNEAVLLSASQRLARPLPDAVRADLAAVGMDVPDPLADTFLADADALREAARGLPPVTASWPAPELAPFALPRPVEPLSAWAERVTARRAPDDTFAGRFAHALAPFLRVRARDARPDDRAVVTAALTAMLRARPGDPYLQYVHGFGPHLEGRLRRLADEGLDPRALAAVEARIAAQRARAVQSAP